MRKFGRVLCYEKDDLACCFGVTKRAVRDWIENRPAWLANNTGWFQDPYGHHLWPKKKVDRYIAGLMKTNRVRPRSGTPRRIPRPLRTRLRPVRRHRR